MTRVFLAVVVLGVASACTVTTLPHGAHDAHEEADEHGHDRDEAELPPLVLPERAARVVVLAASGIDRPTEVVGIVDVHLPAGQQHRAIDALKMRAAAVEADAVVAVEFHHGEHGGEATHFSGTAVRFRDLLGGRSYDVVGSIDASAAMGREDEALRELKTRAREANADLILNVRFEHGDGAGRVRVSGQAIRFRRQTALAPPD